MIGGIIIDWNVVDEVNNTTHIVEFLVKGTGCEKRDYCCVAAEIPIAVLEEINLKDSIWWQNPNVLLQVMGGEDVPFKKVGYSGGNAKSFYKKKANKKV